MSRRLVSLAAAFSISLYFSSCYYDNEEALRLEPAVCDTVNVSYQQQVASILQKNCLGCHSGSTPLGSLNLESYDYVMNKINDGTLLNAISYTNPALMMPPVGKMTACNINTINAWVHQGAKNN